MMTKEEIAHVKEVLSFVYDALEEKGYNPIDQMVGYILSGDPSYITFNKDARSKIQQIDQEDYMEALLTSFLGK